MPVSAANLTSGQSNTDATSYATASVSPGANRLILLAVVSRKTGGASSAPSSVTGNGLTWVQVGTIVLNGAGRITLFRAMGASPSSGAITIDFGSETQASCCWTVDEFDGVDTSGTNGSGAVRQPTTGSSGGSQVTSFSITLGAFASTNNGTYGALGCQASVAVTQGTGFTELAEATATDGVAAQSEWRSDNDTSVDWTHGNARVGGVALELVAAVTAFEIDAQPGSYALAGQLANAAIAAQAAPGSYAAVGVAATFVLDVPAAAGAYSWTGILSQNEIAMPAAPGAVAWTGVVADLAFSSGPGAFELVADPAVFSIAGVAASSALDVPASPGAHVWTGIAAMSEIAAPAFAGAVAWSGAVAGLLADYALVASPGALVWTGVQAELVVLTLSVPTEGFTLPGRATDFTLAARAVDFDLRARPTDLVNPKEK